MNDWIKVANWDVRLPQFVLERQQWPYEWGKHDCVVFMADCVWAITGTDPMPEYRDNMWKTKEEAEAVLEAEGGLIAAMDKRFKRRPSNRLFWRGDPVLLRDAEGQPSLGICTGRSAVAPGQPGENEILATPMKEALIVWAIN